MRFLKFAIENFGPYLDREELDFTDRNGVTIIWADNGRGKTTIMNNVINLIRQYTRIHSAK